MPRRQYCTESVESKRYFVVSPYLSVRKRKDRSGAGPPDPLAMWLHMDSTYPTPSGPQAYHVQGVPPAFGLMFVAGTLSGLLGIGSGAVKVLALDWAMRLPFKVSTTTSNFMIGVTAAASAGVYLSRGYIDPGLTSFCSKTPRNSTRRQSR